MGGAVRRDRLGKYLDSLAVQALQRGTDADREMSTTTPAHVSYPLTMLLPWLWHPWPQLSLTYLHAMLDLSPACKHMHT